MIDRIKIIRVEKSEAGVFGVLIVDGEVFCATLEPQDLDNRVGVSCIPAGTYTCMPIDSPHFGKTFEIMDVPDRTSILFHGGNLASDTKGCVLLGRQYGLLGGDRGILSSRPALREFLQRAGRDKFEIEIKEAV